MLKTIFSVINNVDGIGITYFTIVNFTILLILI